ncbi:hypothetical protein SEA_KALNOKY_91 [Mycobacterium phage Kalnoky]|uniref:Uncharacterized protein n=1 Tax=Mycobacterium phage PurpleHaze TaxID=1983577 RepID=A0A220NS05_9CAUD|nr:hypothetical protein KIJ57_gp08 [Mycobacterium phage Purple Haze]AVJ50832.1 hypothetical protein SEA_OLANP_89 [Mycobacterium phage OlanP]AXC35188.1 hypothetical protein SEA_PHRANNY_83 [Mycobacterium phage Phranny]AXH44137.1 hypothetical protein SEA_KALNOKY_91 [Mycobacterium phage Kalnoky]AXH44545.1 hypothetical protein SEA_MARIUS_91 [Mycobacterium phage Marius]AXH44715.1 hypothetical protein SEA_PHISHRPHRIENDS_87 [Mycobacterium phage PhishRPhriends]AXH44862.1 hypothetical protein SEA_REBA_
MIYGDHKVISVNARGDVLRVLVEDLETGERQYQVIPMP